MQTVRFSLRQIRREWRSGELGALALALVVSAAALTAVGSFSERIGKALTQGANELLAADLVIASRRAGENDWRDAAQERGLSWARTVEFPTVAFAGDGSLLVQAKGVTANYPLRGALEIADEPYGPARRAESGPQPGQVWVDPRIMAELDVALGDVVELGQSQFRIGAVIALEPDAGGGVFNLAPRIMLAMADVGPAGLLSDGARLQHRILIAGPATAVAAFEAWVEPRLGPDQSVVTLAQSQRQVSRALDRAGQFLMLAALTAVLLAGIAIVIAVRQFVQRHLDSVAILRCLGARQGQAVTAFGLVLLWLGIPALLIGALIGYLTQFLLIFALGDLLPGEVPGAGPAPIITALGLGLVTLLGYGLPPLMRLRDVPPVRVLNRQLGHPPAHRYLGDLAAVGFSLALIWWLSADLTLGGVMAGATLAAGIGLAAGAWLLIRAARRLTRGRALGWRYGVANLARKNRGVLLQVAGLGLGLTAIFLLGVVQRDLMNGWRNTLPADAPNYFLINIQPQQVETVRSHLSRGGAVSQGLFPMAVTRLVEINGAEPDPETLPTPRARRRIEGNVNLSWTSQLSAGNDIIAGQWHDPAVSGLQISLAESWADSMGMKLGDQMGFSSGGEMVRGTVTSIRQVDWDSFQPNFFITFTSELDQALPHTLISSVYLPEDRFDVISGLVREAPNVSVLDVGNIMARVRTMIDRVTLTVQVVFVFTLLAGVVVLLAALGAGLRQRQHEGAVMRTLGGSGAQLRSAVFSEFALIGAVAGLLAAVAAVVAGGVLATEVFEIVYQPTWWLPAAGLVLGAVGIGVTGLAGSRSVLKTPPIVTLRQAG